MYEQVTIQNAEIIVLHYIERHVSEKKLSYSKIKIQNVSTCLNFFSFMFKKYSNQLCDDLL